MAVFEKYTSIQEYLTQHLAQFYGPETYYTWYDDITASAIPANYL